MMGLLHFEQGEYQTTIEYWQQLADMLPPDSNEAKEIARYIQQAQERMQPGAEIAMAPPAPPESEAAPQPVTQAQVQPQKADPAPPAAGEQRGASPSQSPSTLPWPPKRPRMRPSSSMPRRSPVHPCPWLPSGVTGPDLPITLTLDDSMAMMPQMRLSAFPQVIVGARISRSGQAMPQSGDLEGEVSPVASSETDPVTVTIGRCGPSSLGFLLIRRVGSLSLRRDRAKR